MLLMSGLSLKNKKVLIREDFNVPITQGHITNDARLRAALPTIQLALEQGAAIILLSHLGRPKEGVEDSSLSLAPVAEQLSSLLKHPVRFEKNWLNGVDCKPHEIVLCENVRFEIGEKANDSKLAQKMAALGDVFVMDAFATAHRAEASTTGIAEYASTACAGPLLEKEIRGLEQALEHPKRPLVAIVGGAKISTKFSTLENLLPRVDYLIVGGGIANTLLAAQEKPVGRSLCELDCISQAKHFLTLAAQHKVTVLLPTDVVVTETLSETAIGTIKAIEEVTTTDCIADIGPKTLTALAEILRLAGTILWCGPIGVFEYPAFASGTQALALAIAQSGAYSIAGGGDTLAAIEKFGVREQLSLVSTGGGAFLEFVEGKILPAIAILKQRAL